ncbi:MAG: alpha/beta fold hydrolase [Burkholderiales bacterium]|nr:alpha/beta fold hydrolase [Burkholderiales bacterium]
MATFVLVHGAWGGAHGFRHVRRLLQAQGHEVFTPSLTGIGERVHLASPLVGLGTHVRDVVNHVLYEDLEGIVLVGFSYGGFVVTGALEHIAARVRHLVYLDAFVPASGDSVNSHVRGTGRARITLGEEWAVNGPPREYDDAAEAAWMTPRRTPQPLGCFTEPVHLAQPLEQYPFTRTYIKATLGREGDPGNAAFWRAAKHAAASPAWRYHEIGTNHMVASNRPAETARLLAEVLAAG